MSESGKPEKKTKLFTDEDKKRLAREATLKPTPGKVKVAKIAQSTVDKRKAKKETQQ